MLYENLLYKNDSGVAIIAINRPKALNALNQDTLHELADALKIADADPDVKVLIITGAGEKAFVAGADIAQMRGLTTLQGREMTILGQNVMTQIENLNKPVIAAVNGYALGGGCELAMACDIRVASSRAKFGQPEVNLGIIPGFGGTQRLSRLVGKGMAKYLCMTAEQITAEEAMRIGLVERVVEPEELMDEAERIARLIMTKAPVAVMMAKKAINRGTEVDVLTGIAYEAEAYTTTFATDDRIEGMTAFTEKRKAEFSGK